MTVGSFISRRTHGQRRPTRHLVSPPPPHPERPIAATVPLGPGEPVDPAVPVDVIESSAFDAGASPDVAVVVSTHNRADFLPDLFEALVGQTLDRTTFEVVVVDDASDDTTWPVLRELARRPALRLRALRLAANAGQGVGRNVGVRFSRAPIVAFTDDDCIPTPQWLESLTAPMRGAGVARFGPVVVQGRTAAWPGDAEGSGPWSRTVWVDGPTWLFETCNVAYRRCDVDEAGGFPARAGAYRGSTGRQVGEDALLGWRVAEGGARLEFAPDAVVHHRHLPARYADWLREQRGRAAFPGLVGRSPFGRRALWRQWFLAPRTAAFDLAMVSVVISVLSRRRAPLACVFPWVWCALPDAANRRGRHPLVRLVQIGLGDAVGFASTASASVRHRRPVL